MLKLLSLLLTYYYGFLIHVLETTPIHYHLTLRGDSLQAEEVDISKLLHLLYVRCSCDLLVVEKDPGFVIGAWKCLLDECNVVSVILLDICI